MKGKIIFLGNFLLSCLHQRNFHINDEVFHLLREILFRIQARSSSRCQLLFSLLPSFYRNGFERISRVLGKGNF